MVWKKSEEITAADQPTAKRRRAMTSGVERAPQRTIVTAAVLMVELGAVWSRRLGEQATQKSLLVLLAQWALETGRGRSCFDWNLGNVKSSGNDGRDYTYFETVEIVPSQYAQREAKDPFAKIDWDNGTKAQVRYFPKHPACRFRAFADLAAGATDYFDEIHISFAWAWPAVIDGDPAEFAHRLKLQHYYTGNEDSYAYNLEVLTREFSNLSPDGAHFDLETVAGVQGALHELGYYTGNLDGISGPMTLAAVDEFERASCLEVDGIVGKDVRRELAVALEKAKATAGVPPPVESTGFKYPPAGA